MRGHGCSVQSHSCTHPFLSRCSAEEVHRELEDSKAAIEDSLGAPVRCFAIPGGDSHPQLRRLVRAAGYRALCTSRPGVNRRIEPFRLERLSVRKGDPLRRFIGLVTLRPLSLAANAFKTHVLDVLKATLGLDHYLQLKRWVLGTERTAELTGSRCPRW
jgi:peptidoglycan/xylan/chitin deacetylase (PgdA/CDA1 family)